MLSMMELCLDESSLLRGDVAGEKQFMNLDDALALSVKLAVLGRMMASVSRKVMSPECRKATTFKIITTMHAQ